MIFLRYWYLVVIVVLLLGNALVVNRYQACHTQQRIVDMTLQKAQEATKAQERQLQLLQEAAQQAQQESQKRIDGINRAEIPTDCRDAIQWGIRQLH